eukprot:s1740_g7.t1
MARRSQMPDSSAPSAPSEPAPSSEVSSWTEAFAPKMEHAMVQKLKDAFLANYPSELLTPDLMPSLRLLSLVYSQLQKKQWRWIPWKYRMSVTRADEVQGQRLPKLPKLEGIQLHSLLMDEPPCLEINSSTMGVNAIRNMMEVHDRAIAICQGAHLANLKAYTQKFISFLTQRTDSDSGLRNANVLEAQQGDQKIWSVISDLMSDRGWTMDDSLHELTHIRHDLPGWLQLRPRIPKSSASSSSAAPRPESGKAKGKGKTKKGSSKGKGKVQWITELKKGSEWKQLDPNSTQKKKGAAGGERKTDVKIDQDPPTLLEMHGGSLALPHFPGAPMGSPFGEETGLPPGQCEETPHDPQGPARDGRSLTEQPLRLTALQRLTPAAATGHRGALAAQAHALLDRRKVVRECALDSLWEAAGNQRPEPGGAVHAQLQDVLPPDDARYEVESRRAAADALMRLGPKGDETLLWLGCYGWEAVGFMCTSKLLEIQVWIRNESSSAKVGFGLAHLRNKYNGVESELEVSLALRCQEGSGSKAMKHLLQIRHELPSTAQDFFEAIGTPSFFLPLLISTPHLLLATSAPPHHGMESTKGASGANGVNADTAKTRCWICMSVEKQLEAAQKFLRGIRSLASYEEVRDKQALGVQKALDKVQCFTAAQAAAWLAQVQPDLWGDSQVESFREKVAFKTRPVESDQPRLVTQDFSMLPYYLNDELAAAIGQVDGDAERLLFRLCHHAAQLSLRNASEATKATLVVMAHWAACKRGGLSPKQQHDLFIRHKPAVTKYLIAPPDCQLLMELPLQWQDLDQQMIKRAFPTGKPADIGETAKDICDYVRRLPLRKDNRLLQGTGGTPTSVPVGLPSGVLPVDDICKVVAACSQSLQVQLDRGQSSQSVSSRSSQVLALCDASPEEKAAMLGGPQGDLRRDEQATGHMPSAVEPVDPRGPDTMSVEDQLAALRADMGQGKTEAMSVEPEPVGAMKRPAASKSFVAAPKPKGRPRAKPKAASVVKKTTKQSMKRPAVASPARTAAPTRRRAATASSGGELSRAERRKRVLAVVPQKLRQQFSVGCGRCRYTAGPMAPKKDDKEESEYTYSEVEAEAEGEPEPAPTRSGGDRARAERSSKENRPTLVEAPAASAAPAAPVTSPARDSSSDRAPRARSHRSPHSPRARGRAKERRSRSGRRHRRERPKETEGSKGHGRGSPKRDATARLASAPPLPPASKSKGKGRSQMYCPHCCAKVKGGGGAAGLSQHMFWNTECLAWQQYGNGDQGCSWDEALAAAQELKEKRTKEAYAEQEPVMPARSLRHRKSLEHAHDDEEADEDVPRERTEKKRRHKEKKRHRRRTPSPDVRAGPKGPRRRPPSSDDDADREGRSAKRRSAPEEVWIKVPRAALMG